jgi:hypothetical protein
MLPYMDNNSPVVRYPTTQQRNYTEKSLRSSSINALVNSSMISSQVSLPNRKVIMILDMKYDSFVYRRFFFNVIECND